MHFAQCSPCGPRQAFQRALSQRNKDLAASARVIRGHQLDTVVGHVHLHCGTALSGAPFSITRSIFCFLCSFECITGVESYTPVHPHRIALLESLEIHLYIYRCDNIMRYLQEVERELLEAAV